MRLPDFTGSGDLPVGVHCASLRETLERFALDTLSVSPLGSGWNASTTSPPQPGTWLGSSSSGRS
jgi:hypothetical protein